MEVGYADYADFRMVVVGDELICHGGNVSGFILLSFRFQFQLIGSLLIM